MFFFSKISSVKQIIPENTARRIIPRRGFPRVECAHGKPCPGGSGNTWGPPAELEESAVNDMNTSSFSLSRSKGKISYPADKDSDSGPAASADGDG